MSPGFIDRLRPYFKSRPRTPRTPAQQAAAPTTRMPAAAPGATAATAGAAGTRASGPGAEAAGGPRAEAAATTASQAAGAPAGKRGRRRAKRERRRGRRRAAATAPVAVPAANALHAQRGRLARQYAELQSDLGGLVYEMAIRDSFRLDVLTRRAAALQAVDIELAATERALRGGATSFATACPRCGTPSTPGAAFCSSCGNALSVPPAHAVAAQPGRGQGGEKPAQPRQPATQPQQPAGPPAQPSARQKDGEQTPTREGASP